VRKPNLIVFLPDQQRTDTIASYPGSEKVHTPNLAKLAAQATIFERAYVTQPVCTPSRSSLMTGQWPHANGCTKNSVPLAPQHLTFVELLNDPDYHAGYMGKWHLGRENSVQRGFQEWVSTEGASDYAGYLIGQGKVPDKSGQTFSTEMVSKLPLELSKPRFLETRACEFITRHQKRPFILFVAFVEPHSPYFGPLNNEHAVEEITLDSSATAEVSGDIPLRYRLMQEWQEEQGLLDRKRLPEQYYFGLGRDEYLLLKQRYLGLVSMVDMSIGAILGTIETCNLSEETIIVHTSDHGDMLGAHHLFGKEVMYEQATRVPLLITMPGQKRSARIAQPVSHIDFVPTLLELLGAPRHLQCGGSSLAPLLHGTSVAPAPVFMEWSPNRMKLAKHSSLARPRVAKRAMEESTRTVVTPDGWKLSLRDKDLCELYNLKDDPEEMRNRYSEPADAPIVAKWTAEIKKWQLRVDDSLEL